MLLCGRTETRLSPPAPFSPILQLLYSSAAQEMGQHRRLGSALWPPEIEQDTFPREEHPPIKSPGFFEEIYPIFFQPVGEIIFCVGGIGTNVFKKPTTKAASPM